MDLKRSKLKMLSGNKCKLFHMTVNTECFEHFIHTKVSSINFKKFQKHYLNFQKLKALYITNNRFSSSSVFTHATQISCMHIQQIFLI